MHILVCICICSNVRQLYFHFSLLASGPQSDVQRGSVGTPGPHRACFLAIFDMKP